MIFNENYFLVGYFSSALSTKLQDVLERKSRECKVLLVCRNGGIVSETVAAAFNVAKYKTWILKDGYLSYRQFLGDHFHNEDRYRGTGCQVKLDIFEKSFCNDYLKILVWKELPNTDLFPLLDLKMEEKISFLER